MNHQNKMKYISAIFLILIGAPLILLAQAGGTMLLWKWFVVPLGIPNISIAQAYGLSCLFSLFSYRGYTGIEKTKPWEKVIIHGGAAAICITLGYFALLAMQAGW